MQTASEASNYKSGKHINIVVSPAVPGIRRMRDVEIPARDGNPLSANIYLPDTDKPVPLIMAMTIYRKESHEAHYQKFLGISNTHLGVMRFSEDATFEGPDPSFWCVHGYAVLHFDARGFGKSPGKPNPWSHKSFEDYYDAIEWASSQAWCNGRVGLSGVSFLGIGQYHVAALKPPSLKAINPWDARTDLFRSNFLGGIPNTVMSPFIFENFTIPSLHNPADADAMRAWVDVRAAPRLLSDPAYQDRLNLLAGVSDIEVPTLIGGSVSDQAKHSRDAFENFMNIRTKDKWLYVHRDPEWAAYYDEAGLAIQRRFFDHFLKQIDNGWDRIPRVLAKVYENRDRFHYLNADQWPVPNTSYRRVYLASDARLGPVTPQEAGAVSYVSDSSGRVTFDLVFDDDTDLVGHPMLKLFASIEDGDEMDLFIGLKKFDRLGNEVFFLGESGNNPNDIVSRGWLRASHRELAQNSTDWRPVMAHRKLMPVRAGEVVELQIEIHPTATRFRKGERLQLVIQGESIQPSDVAIGFDEKLNRGRHTLHFGGSYASYLQLPVVPEISVEARQIR